MLLTLINKTKLHNNSLPLIIFNSSGNKVCILKDITIGPSKVIKEIINEIALTARDNDLETDIEAFVTQKIHTVNTHIKDNTLL